MIEQEILYFYNFGTGKKPFKGYLELPRKDRIVVIGKRGPMKTTMALHCLWQAKTLEEAVEGWNAQVLANIKYHTGYIEYAKKQFIT